MSAASAGFLGDPRVETSASLRDAPLLNADLAPTPVDERTWSMWHLASLLRRRERVPR
ncbi:MAG: hypothetical protein OEU54_12820 [Gemmatimonadota bacterium]|nr:hypothetical protein [Gemmatimonadota bacterium]